MGRILWVSCILYAFVGLSVLPSARAEATDATKSESSGSGLQFATAGVLAQFTITAKDESGVRRTSGGDEWIVELDGTRSLTGSVVDNLDGTYQVSYTATKSGSYEAGVKLAKSGGLTGSYFENVWFFYTPVKVTVDPQINMDWGTGLITPTGANYISIRWVGKVKTQYAETYTFYATTDDGARLWVDNVPLIDRWDSYCNETSATISLKANVFYDIKMEYKQVTGSAFARLSWASQSTPKEIVPSSQLFYETQAKKSPFSFIVMPNVANGTRSTAAGTGMHPACFFFSWLSFATCISLQTCKALASAAFPSHYSCTLLLPSPRLAGLPAASSIFRIKMKCICFSSALTLALHARSQGFKRRRLALARSSPFMRTTCTTTSVAKEVIFSACECIPRDPSRSESRGERCMVWSSTTRTRLTA
jgi:hypothetical protein